MGAEPNRSERDAIEQIRHQNEPLTFDQQLTILEAIHRKLPNGIRILRDHSHNSWVCGKRDGDFMCIFSSSPQFEVINITAPDRQLINATFRDPNNEIWVPWHNISPRSCLKAKDSQEQFVILLAYAMRLDMDPNNLKNLKDELANGTKDIRSVIADWLLNDTPNDD